MDAARFTYEHTAAGWQLQTDEPGLGGPLEGAFRYELRLGDLPVHLAVVGHCRVMGMWCVFAREAGSSVVRGIALRADRYGAHGFDPFVVAAEALESESARAAIGADTNPGVQTHTLIPPERGYLAEARRRFLLGSPTARQSLYCSVLPQGFPRRLSPLTCFATEGGRLLPDDPAAEASGVGRDELSATPGPPPSPDPPPPTPTPDANPTAAPRVPTREPDRAADDALERGVLLMELERVEGDLRRRLRALQIALAVATALLTAALAIGLWWTSKQLQRVEAGPTAPQETRSDDPASGSWLP